MKKAPPAHAYSFSGTLLFSTASIINYGMDGNNIVTNVALSIAAGSLIHGIYDLHQENRLQRVIRPAKKVFSFFKSQLEQESNTVLVNEINLPGFN